jgi:hypothetical protein
MMLMRRLKACTLGTTSSSLRPLVYSISVSIFSLHIKINVEAPYYEILPGIFLACDTDGQKRKVTG